MPTSDEHEHDLTLGSITEGAIWGEIRENTHATDKKLMENGNHDTLRQSSLTVAIFF